MIANSVKYKGFSCFQNNWTGFDEFKPISVIIGRNNSGKSHLLDLVKGLTNPMIDQEHYSVRCTTVLEEDVLKGIFPEDVYVNNFNNNLWNLHGRELIGAAISWETGANPSGITLSLPEEFVHRNSHINQDRQNRIESHLSNLSCPLSSKVFRRILADRDIELETSSSKLELASNGRGATNIIRCYITDVNFSESLIQVQLLNALAQIFGSDGVFEKIEIRHHAGPDHWEVFLGEPKKKDLVPLGSSGSGLKTVLLVLLNLLVVPEIERKKKSKYVFAFEELENNLHPSLLRRLFKYIAEYVEREKCFVFLTTHSSVALDFFCPRSNSQIIHVTHDGKSANAKTITAHFEHVGLINELGARPSDLLQANGIIWLEGPSDRIYINRFIELFSDGELREGRDYQCAFYGGSVLASSEFSSPEDSRQDFTNLLRINNNVAVICDGDRIALSGKGSRIKRRVQRIASEVESIDGAFLWITEAKEIENYIPGEVWAKVYDYKKSVPDPGKYDRFPTQKIEEDDFLRKNLERKSFDKCGFASRAAQHLTKDILETRFEIKSKMEELVLQIRKWNE